VTRANALVAQLVVDLQPAFEGWPAPIVVGIGWDGAVYAAARRSTEAPTESRGLGIFPKSKLDEATDYLIARCAGATVQTLLVPGQTLAVSYIQPFPGGILLAGARCHWRPEGAEQNAIVVEWSARELTRFTLGDGIADLRVTRDGTIWASYFDEGVFGNYGWSHPGPTAIGASGLVAFSTSGQIVFIYDSETAHTDAVCDAYAMNVEPDGDVWLYFYTKFPIVRIRSGVYQAWEFGVGGGRALAVRNDRVLLFGDYKRGALGRLIQLRANGSTKLDGEVVLVDHDGTALKHVAAWGVGHKLYILQDRRVLVLEDW
jgi:hypothetical protein